jgi:hypothetical protein
LRNLLFIAVLFFFVDASRSQVIDGVEIVKPRIITGEWDSVTKKFPVAVEFWVAKGWHLYWLNPGDAGSPPEVKWSLPMDWKVGKLQFPVPQHVVEDGFESYAYYDKLVLYAEIASPVAPKPSDVIEADIKWMVCKDICVAGKQAIKWPYEMANVYHEWPKLPFVMSLEEAGYRWAVSPDASLSSLGGFTHYVEIKDTTGSFANTKAFYPYITEGLMVRTDTDNGVIAVTSNGRTPFSIDRDLNGLVFIGDKVYWLKAP